MGKTIIDSGIIEQTKKSKTSFLAFGSFTAVGFIVLMVGILLSNMYFVKNWVGTLFFMGGYLVIAAPCMLAFVLKIGLFVYVGPVFSTSQTRIGNVIYTVTERDYSSQAAMNIGFTLIKAFIIFLLAVIISPVVTIVLFFIYNSNHKKAIEYADINGIDKKTVPHLNKGLVIAVFAIVIALFAAAIISSNISDKHYEEQKKEDTEVYSALLETAVGKIPDEYYAESYKGEISTGGFVAEFILDGKKVVCGKFGMNISNAYDKIDSNTVYYLIGDTLYIDLYGDGNFEISSDSTIKKYIEIKCISNLLGNGAEYILGSKYEDNIAVTYKYNSLEHIVHINENGEIVKYVINEFPADLDSENFDEKIYQVDSNKDLSDFKSKATELMNR